MKLNRKGFTLVEIMIVVAIIAILAAIAIPNFLRSRNTSQMNACIANLKQIDGAVEQAKMAGIPDPKLEASTTEGDGGIYGDTGYIKTEPICPADKKSRYTLASAKEGGTKVPTCNAENIPVGYEHELPDAGVAATVGE